jgi:hypothetical protein
MASTNWQMVEALAINAGSKYPALVAAQWALESSWGEAVSGKNNFFGIKGTGTSVKTQEYINGRFITINAQFQDFKSPQECVTYLVTRWHKDYRGYTGVEHSVNRDQAAYSLVKQGYATDPDYARKLIKLMNENSPIDMENTNAGFLKRAFGAYANKPHQDAAISGLEASLTPEQLTRFKAAYSPTQVPQVKPKNNPLKVPYFYQRDSKTGHGERMCFSSSMAMALDYLKPDVIKGDDDWYLQQVFRFGDSVSSEAQIKAANSLGFKARFRTDGTEQSITKLIDNGYPIPIGILHKGSCNSPQGGGHWICVIGYDASYFYVNDPFGELDAVNGGYPKVGPTDGKNKKYNRKRVLDRWNIKNNHDGWYVDLSGN